MVNRYSNQNHGINRNKDVFEKTASVYERQQISNRKVDVEPLRFSDLNNIDANDVLDVLKKEASELDGLDIEKQANVITNPFEAFGHAKHYIASKLGVSSDLAKDLASSVMPKAQQLQKEYGGEIAEIIPGIIDHMDKDELKSRMGFDPMRQKTPNETEEMVKERLMAEQGMNAFEADRYKKNVMQQARNLATVFRMFELPQIANAVVSTMVEGQDASLVHNISSSDRLKSEVEYHLSNSAE